MLTLILTITAGILFILAAGITESTQLYEKKAPEQEKENLNAAWHTTQLLERIFAIAFGFMLCLAYLEYGFWYAFAGILFVVAALFKTIYDGLINLKLGRGFFHVSTTTTSTMEKWTPWYVKIALITLSVFLLFVIPRKEKNK